MGPKYEPTLYVNLLNLLSPLLDDCTNEGSCFSGRYIGNDSLCVGVSGGFFHPDYMSHLRRPLLSEIY